MNKFHKFVILAVCLVLVSLMLVACGGEATPGSSVAVTANSGGLTSIQGAKEVELDASLQKALTPDLPGITDTSFKMYVSEDKAAALSENLHKALISAGYTFALPGQDKPVSDSSGFNGTYTKAGMADLTFIASPLTSGSYSEQELTKIGADAAGAKKLIEQIKGKSSLAIVLFGKGLADQIKASTATTAAATTQIATTTALSSTTAATVAATIAAKSTVAPTVTPTVATKPTVALTVTAAARTASTAPKTVKKGNFVMTLNRVEYPSSFVVVGIDNAPKAGTRFVTLDLTIASEADADEDANTLYATLKDSKGNKYQSYLLGREPELPSENNIAEGQKVQGWVTFEVPATATGLVFVYEPLLEEPLIIEIPLD